MDLHKSQFFLLKRFNFEPPEIYSAVILEHYLLTIRLKLADIAP